MISVMDRLDALTEVADLVEGRVPGEVEERSRAVIAHASRRLAAGPQTTVALAGATGSGKSSLFNALSGTRLAEQGPRRPTTSQTLAVSFAATNPALLDLLGVQRRHEAVPPTPAFADLVLLDLPDHDSTATVHRDEVDKMVGLVDQFIWVLDPQKYADEAIHRRYLRPLAKHREVITVVLNQADKLNADQLGQCMAHIRRLLDDDGLGGVPLLATSAVTGMGVPELASKLASLSTGKRAASMRLAADVQVAADALDEAVGRADVPARAEKESVARLNAQLSSAAGVDIVVAAVRDSVRLRGRRATGWPLVTWIARLRPDPLKRLRLGGRRPDEGAPELTRSSLPARSAASSAHLSSGLRGLTQELGAELPDLWRDAVARAVQGASGRLPDALDRAVVGTDLRVSRGPLWWRLIRVLQWLLIAAVAVGIGWLSLNAVLGYLGLPPVGTLPVGADGGLRVPLPTIVLLGGLIAGVLVSGCSQLIISAGARGAARRARRSLDRAVAEVGKSLVLTPAEEELARYAAARRALDRLVA